MRQSDLVTTDDERWFGELDFDVEYEEAEDSIWVNLRRRTNPKAVVPRYGRGSSREEALESARKRFEVEQIG